MFPVPALPKPSVNAPPPDHFSSLLTCTLHEGKSSGRFNLLSFYPKSLKYCLAHRRLLLYTDWMIESVIHGTCKPFHLVNSCPSTSGSFRKTFHWFFFPHSIINSVLSWNPYYSGIKQHGIVLHFYFPLYYLFLLLLSGCTQLDLPTTYVFHFCYHAFNLQELFFCSLDFSPLYCACFSDIYILRILKFKFIFLYFIVIHHHHHHLVVWRMDPWASRTPALYPWAFS